MNDSQRTFEISNLIKKARKLGSHYLEAALQVAETLEDPEDKPSYIAIIAKELAQRGTMADLEKALHLARMTRPMDKQIAFEAIVSRLVAESKIERALDCLRELEVVAVEFEADNDYDYVTRSGMWEEIGNMYGKVSEHVHAQQMWMRAVKVAQAGQNSPRRQDMVDCYKALRSIAEKMWTAGYKEEAVNIARSIMHESFRVSTLKTLAEWQGNTESK